MADINPKTGMEYYAGSVEDIQRICRVLNIGNGRLERITPELVKFYMGMVEDTINDYLVEYYFIPIRAYRQVMPDGSIKKIFPGRLRRLAQYWAAGLLLTSEFQGLEPNSNETAERYIEDSRKELYQITLYNQRLPGQRYKSAWGRTMLPTMQPGLPPEQNW